jgi:phospholipid/cholesterol/gamma-HCH transport system ATP-binding protein
MTGPARPPSPPAPPAAPRTGPQAGPRPEEAQAEPVIELVGVHKTLGGAEVLRGLDLQLFPRETLVIIGRSGSGKSVTLKHIVGLLQPDRGLVRVFGQELSKIGKRDLHAIRLRTGYLFQSGALINWLTIEENVALPLHEHRSDLPEKEVLARVRQKLEMVELGNAGNR